MPSFYKISVFVSFALALSDIGTFAAPASVQGSPAEVHALLEREDEFNPFGAIAKQVANALQKIAPKVQNVAKVVQPLVNKIASRIFSQKHKKILEPTTFEPIGCPINGTSKFCTWTTLTVVHQKKIQTLKVSSPPIAPTPMPWSLVT
ncbi:hypothetical protein GALMADRAFT_208857 [Galerina marginata CBS 339.88]|uniref:Uncharacterized protein n=1 Tax=Galerina marginata (strain CBS 339.88) TaxID=685588 RepID=A0A067THZ4_GALM3|nr:hypothetical protein GALMADRAFT_208857 [Galerina marginata CBS 339.88]